MRWSTSCRNSDMIKHTVSPAQAGIVTMVPEDIQATVRYDEGAGVFHPGARLATLRFSPFCI